MYQKPKRLFRAFDLGLEINKNHVDFLKAYWGVLSTKEDVASAVEFFSDKDNVDDYLKNPWIVFYSSELVEKINDIDYGATEVMRLKEAFPDLVVVCADLDKTEKQPVYNKMGKSGFIIGMNHEGKLVHTTNRVKLYKRPTSSVELLLKQIGIVEFTIPFTAPVVYKKTETIFNKGAIDKINQLIISRKDEVIGTKRIYPEVLEMGNFAFSSSGSLSEIEEQIKTVENKNLSEYLEMLVLADCPFKEAPNTNLRRIKYLV